MMYRFTLIVLGLLVLCAPAFAQSQSNWGGATLAADQSFIKAYCYPSVSPECWAPAGGCDDWTKVSITFTAASSDGYFMLDCHTYNSGAFYTVAWIDDIKVTNMATGVQLLNDPGLESGGTGFFPWCFEGNMAYAPGEGVGGSTCVKSVGVLGAPFAFDKVLQYNGWGTGTLPMQAGMPYELSFMLKTAQVTVPEPGSIVCLLSGLGVLVGIRRRK